MKEATKNLENIVIIGSGPAAFVAGIYAATANKKPLIINEETTETLSWNGLDKIAGLQDLQNNDDFLNRLKQQAEKFDLIISTEKVEHIIFDKIITVKTNKREIQTKIVILEDLEVAKRIFRDEGELNKIKKSGLTKTHIENLYVCGSINSEFKEAIVLSASGCIAFLECKEYLEDFDKNFNMGV